MGVNGLMGNVGDLTDKGTLITQATADAAAADASANLVIREDNAKEVQRLLSKALAAALEEVGLVAEGYAKKACPVDTGRLRNSITHITVPGEKAAYIGTNVEYARYVEMGTSKNPKGQPFLRPAASNHGAKYAAIMRKHLQGGE